MSRLIYMSLPSLFILSIYSVVSASDWPTYQHDYTRVGASKDNLPTELMMRWIYTSPEPPENAWAGPRSEPIEGWVMKHRVAFDDAIHVAVAGERCFFGSSVDHQIYCVNSKTGKPYWTFYTDGPIRLAPTVSEGKVYFGSDDGFAYCLDAKSGELIWKYRAGKRDDRLLARGKMISRWPVRTGLLVEDGVCYFGAGIFPHETVYLCALNAETGKVIWKNDRISQENAGRNDLSPQGYLLANNELLFVPSGRTLPAAFNKKTGEFVHKRSFGWRSTGGGLVGGAKALLADGQIYSAGAHHFLAMEQENGDTGFAWLKGRQMTINGDKAYIATGKEIIAIDRPSYAVASTKRQEIYIKRRSLRGLRRSKPKEYEQKMAALEKEDNRLAQIGLLWKTPSTCEGALALSNNLLLAGGKDQVVAFDLASGEETWSAKVEGEVRGLAIANGGIFASTTVGKIYGFSDATKLNEGEHVSRYPKEVVNNPYPQDELTALYEEAAKDILDRTGTDRGFCLVLGSEKGRLAYELAKRSKLRIYGVEPDAKKLAASRRALNQAGLYGSRVSLFSSETSSSMFSNYFANLVVSDSMLLSGKMPSSIVDIARHVKPCGGQVCLGVPQKSPAAGSAISGDVIKQQLAEMYLSDDAKIESDSTWATLTRDTLSGVGNWSHQYGNVSNTSFSQDNRVKGNLGVLWYGDPGPSSMINRHEAASAPLSTHGRMFIQGTDSIMAYDAYNGLFLWEYENPGAIRTGVFNNNETSNLAAGEDALFVAVNDAVTVLDAETGKIRATYHVPKSEDGLPRAWGYVAYHEGILYGTSTLRTELASSLRRRGRTVGSSTDAIFAVDVKTGKRLWVYRGEHLMHVTITIGDGNMYFIESSISDEQREALLRQDKTELKKLTGDAAKKKEQELKEYDVRLAVALDAVTGEKLWSQPVDVTNVSGVSSGGGNIAMMYHSGHVVICGANANGHYWSQFLSGKFKKRRLVILDAESGKKLWYRDADYMNRPLIVGNDIFAEPWAFDLHTGKPKTRLHPLTGKKSNWQFSRPGHHCGVVTATPNMMFFRSGFIGYYDLYSDSGTRHFSGQRLGCWINAIPGNGLLMIPEASAGCVCLFSITSTVVLEPREDRDPAWGIYSVAGPLSPVKHLAINLGAPGDRRSESGKLWLSYPRPSSRNRMEFVFDIKPEFYAHGDFFSGNSESLSVEGHETSWVFSSAARGISKFAIPLLDEKQNSTASYSVKLYFAEIDASQPGERVFDVKIQGNTVAKNLDVAKESGGMKRSLVKSFSGIPVNGNLVIELHSAQSKPSLKQMPILSGIEVNREELSAGNQ